MLIQQQKIKSLTIKDFGPFEGEHSIVLPDSGLVLVKGRVAETGDGSGAGKSFFLKSIAYLFGGNIDTAAELQTWLTDQPLEVSAELVTGLGIVKVSRHNGLHVESETGKYKGRAAAAELDRVFGMEEAFRSVVTYRGQRQPGLFLALSDEKKKTFFGTLLGLNAHEKVAKAAHDAVAGLERDLDSKKQTVVALQEQLQTCETQFEEAKRELQKMPLPQKTESAIATAREGVVLNKQLAEKYRQEVAAIRTQSQQELEAILSTINAKTGAIAKRSEPIEITALRNKAKELTTKLNKLVLDEQSLIAGFERDKQAILSTIAEKKVAISNKPGLVERLQKLQTREEVLRSQKCSECHRPWEGEELAKTLSKVTDDIQKTKEVIARLEQAESDVVALGKQLKEIPAPAHNQNIDILKEEVTQIESEITFAVATWNTKKDTELHNLGVEARDAKIIIKEEYSNKVKSLEEGLAAAQKQLDEATQSELHLVGIQGTTKTKLAIAKERNARVAQAKEALTKAAKEESDLAAKVALEKDIVALVGRSGFLGAIVEEVLAETASVANGILEQVANVRHISVDFETEKEVASTRNTVARICPVIYNRGRKVTFGAGISGGMQAAVELAIDLAVGDVVSRRRGSYPGWLVLDETFHGLGGIAKESCLEMLSNYAADRLVLIVDHSSEFQGLFHSVIEIEMSNGRSKIVV